MSSPFLGLPVPRTIGQGINPAAPDPQGMIGPQIPQGPGVPQGPGLGLGAELGMGQPQQQAQPSPMSPGAPPEDLSSLNPLSKMGLLMQNVSAGLQGQAQMPTNVRMQQLRQQYDQKRKVFMDGVNMLDGIHKKLGDVPAKDRAKWLAGQEEQFVQLAGGSEDARKWFKGTVGADNAQGMLELYKDNPVVQMGLSQGWSMNQVMAFSQSPMGMEISIGLQDEKNMPLAKEAMDKLLNDPKLRGERDRLAREGTTAETPGGLGIDIDRFKALNAQASKGPGGTQISPDMMYTIERNEAELFNGPGMSTRDSTKETQKLIREHPFRMAEQLAKSAGKGGGGSSRAFDPSQVPLVLDTQKRTSKAIDDADKLLNRYSNFSRMMTKAEELLSSGKVKTGKFDKWGQTYSKYLGEDSDVAIVEQALAAGVMQALDESGMKGTGPISNIDLEAIEKTAAKPDQGDEYVLDDIRARLAAMRNIGKMAVERRNRGARDLNSINVAAGFGEMLEAIPEREWAPYGEKLPSGEPPPKAGMVRMVAPNGELGDVPEAGVKAAEAKGAKRASP